MNKTKMKSRKPKTPKTVLVLRTVAEDMTSRNGFKWPASGPVEAPDWKPTKECGNGLHGWVWGAGDWSLKHTSPLAKWLVVAVRAKEIIDLGGKVKFPRGDVLFVANGWVEAMAFIRGHASYAAKKTKVATGNYGHAAATGDCGHAAATGYYGHAAATGDCGHAAATGYYGHAAATGYYGHAAATGNYGHAAATGNYGHAAATGYYGHAAATGYYGHAAATGDYGFSVTGYEGRSKAGANGCLAVLWWDKQAKRPRLAVGYVGEAGIKADTWYSVVDGLLKEVA